MLEKREKFLCKIEKDKKKFFYCCIYSIWNKKNDDFAIFQRGYKNKLIGIRLEC